MLTPGRYHARLDVPKKYKVPSNTLSEGQKVNVSTKTKSDVSSFKMSFIVHKIN